MHASWFQYNITKPYPFRWFTPVVIIGGIILTALFTFLTVATGGYALQPYYTTTPNITLNQQYWFTKAPFAWRGSLSPSCQPRELPIGSQFFTSNLGLSYQLSSVAKVNATTNAVVSSLPSLPYLNQVMTDCKMVDITMNFRKLDFSNDQSGMWWSWTDGSTVARVNCTVATEDGNLVATYSTTYDRFDGDFSYVIQNNIHTNVSMWWATRLLDANYLSVMMALATMPSYGDDSDNKWMSATMVYTTNQTDNIKSYDIFSLSYFAIASSGAISNAVQQPVSLMYNSDSVDVSMALTEALNFARVMYSAILVDLGQTQTSNLLLDNTMLQWALNHPDDGFRNDPGNPLNCSSASCNFEYARWNTLAGPENFDNSDSRPNDPSPRYERVNMSDAYEKFAPPTSGPGALGTRPATIFTQYSCSIPMRRDLGAVFLTVLVAVLVYLRAAWALLNTIAKPLVVKRDPVGANTCSGGTETTDILLAGGIASTNTGARHRHIHSEDSDQLLVPEPVSSYKGYTNDVDHRSVKS